MRNTRRAVYAGLAFAGTQALMRLPPRLTRTVCRMLVAPLLTLLYGRRGEQNLLMAFGDALRPQARRHTLHRAFRNLADLPAEVLGAVHRGPDFVRGCFVGTEGIAKWRRLQEEFGGSMVALTGHVGNWELLLQYLQIEGARPVGGVVATRVPNPRLNDLVERMRGRYGVRTLYNDSGVKALAEILRRGETVGLVPDQDLPRMAGTFVDFLGRPAYTPTGPARLALATRAPIVCAFCRRVEGGRLEVTVADPILPDVRAPREAETVRLTRAWSDCVADFVRAHPDQWVWLHDRWHTVPADVGDRRVE